MNRFEKALKQRVRLCVQSLTANLVGLVFMLPVMVIPGLPSSFYGEVRVNDAFVPDGTVVRGLIGGNVFAEGYTQTYQGASVYTLDVPGDDAATVALDGGLAGDKVQFEIGGVLADQTGTWQSGTSVRLDLTAAAEAPLDEPQPTSVPLPTQTVIILASPLPTSAPAKIAPTSFVPTESALPSLGASSVPAQASTWSSSSLQISATPTPTKEIIAQELNASPTSASSSNSDVNNSDTTLPTIAALAVVIVLGGVFWVTRKKKTS